MSRRLRTVLAVLAALVAVGSAALVEHRSSQAFAREPRPGATTALLTPVLSPRRLPELLASNITDTRTREAVQPHLDSALPNTCIIVTNHGRVVVDHGVDVVEPASTVKLLTARAVLESLDPASRLRTTAEVTDSADDGVIEGDLYLVGGGDPLLTTPGYEVSFINRDQLKNDFAQLADRVVDSGVRRITGGIVGDDSRYDQERWVATWPERYRNQGFVGPLSALTVNDGQTGYSTDPDSPAENRVPGDPPVLAAETLRTMLVDRGVSVEGDAVSGSAPSDAAELAVLESVTLRELVGQMLIESDDTTAELLTKELGLQVSGSGSTAAGIQAIVDHLTAEGLPIDGLQLTDGSGLDEGNRINCDLLAAVLDRPGENSQLEPLLPIAAQNGTLRPRMRRTPAEGLVAAKTGTLDHVNALAGYARTPTGGPLTFVYGVVGENQPRGYVPLDEFAIALATVPTGPDLAQLSPEQP